MSKININIKTCGECPLFDAENEQCLADPEDIGGPYVADFVVEDGDFCAHFRNKIIRRCHEWVQKQETTK